MVPFDRQLYVFGGAADNNPSKDVHCFDLATQAWSVIPPHPDSQLPSGRLFHAGAIVGEAMFIFGGTVENNIRSGEMYRFQLAAYPKCTLHEDFGRLLESGQFTDINFLVGEVEAEPAAFRMVLDYIYTDQIDPTKGYRERHQSNEVVLSMMQVYMLAVQFHMKRLENLCINYLEASVNHKNVLVALKNASQLKLFFIKEFCLRFIIKDATYNQIVMSKEFETLDQPLMVEIIRRRQTPQRRSLQEDARSETGPTIHDDLKHFLRNGAEFADISLVLEGTPIPSHKAVLAARSSYFEGMVRSFCPPDNKVIVSIGEMVPSRQSFDSLLRYIYYGDVVMPPEDSLYLFSATRRQS